MALAVIRIKYMIVLRRSDGFGFVAGWLALLCRLQCLISFTMQTRSQFAYIRADVFHVHRRDCTYEVVCVERDADWGGRDSRAAAAYAKAYDGRANTHNLHVMCDVSTLQWQCYPNRRIRFLICQPLCRRVRLTSTLCSTA